jgi:hypothetical protein
MMARHVKDDEGPKTLELGKLVAGGGGVHGHKEPEWDEPRGRRVWPVVVYVGSTALAAWMGWTLADIMSPDPISSSTPPAAVETVTAEASPGPTVTRWRTRPPAAGKVPEATPVPGPTVTRWRTRLEAPSPAPTVTAWRTRLMTPQEEMDDEDPQIPGSPGPGD